MSKTALGGQFTIPGPSLTVERIDYGAMQPSRPIFSILTDKLLQLRGMTQYPTNSVYI